MPHIISSSISRKDFLRKSIRIGGALATWGMFYEHSLAADNSSVHLAILADTHVAAYKNEQYRGFFPSKNFQEVLGQVSGKNPQAMIITGDIARLTGELGDYSAIKDHLQSLGSDMPVLMALGNHDNRANFYDIFKDDVQNKQEVFKKHVLVVDYGQIRIVLLDSLMYVNKTPGFLGQQQRNWLQTYLDMSDDKPVFIFVHHTLNNGDSDLLDAERLFNILKKHKKVKAIFYGHSHIYKVTERNKIKLINIPAVGYNFIDSQPVGWLEARITPDSGLFTLHAIGGNIDKDGEETEVKWR
jgi:3',5'-cyclic AMP phosphodiesterase CpdA